MDVQEAANEARSYFVSKTRDDGTSYIATKDAPEWVGDLCYEAHGGMLPNDWRYDAIDSALDYIAAGDDDVVEFADAQVDVCTSDLLAWIGSHGHRMGYCDEAQEQGGVDAEANISQRIMVGQYLEASEVYGLVLAALEDHVDHCEVSA